MRSTRHMTELDRLRAALVTVAKLVERNPTFAPIFLRLEEEIEAEEALASGDVLARARAVAAQSATR
ncbi:hypothetical protein [Roseisalinus antarcticus]|uniref:Uncharacterized protein n=1 Tax=Roseisalinus antarcticus TaxID=254357 RepID=A0A1Y5U144_9RHOB|nr:hypothetical protein [Roseisalinus antarcticus]SLN77694.1 hypothetical protein ROA7023_04479 [Roseisalinus antarcticus]